MVDSPNSLIAGRQQPQQQASYFASCQAIPELVCACLYNPLYGEPHFLYNIHAESCKMPTTPVGNVIVLPCLHAYLWLPEQLPHDMQFKAIHHLISHNAT